jgi:MoxR-like ATPase
MTENRVSLKEMRDLLGMGGAKPEDKGESLGQAKLNDDGSVEIFNATIGGLSKVLLDQTKDKLKPELAKVIATTTAEEVETLQKKLQGDVDASLERIEKLAQEVRPIVIRNSGKLKQLKGVRHNQFENLLAIMGAGQPVLMVGPAGTGKTKGAEDAAEALDLSFHSISVGSQTSKSDLVGYMDGGGTYRTTQFRQAYEFGGVFLLDEADAGNSNVLILLNAALSNGYMAFPDGMVHRHADFRMVATANTFGNGANRQYVGRNQLDAATLDRFTVLVWDIDDKVESAMAGTAAEGKRWLKAVKAVRKRVVDELELRAVISPRATLRGAQLLAAGMEFETVLQVALVGNLPAANRDDLANLARAAYQK